MEWLSWIGGGAGLVALIKVCIDVFMAKSGKTKVDVGNMREMLDEAHKMYDKSMGRYEELEKKFDQIVSKVNKLERTVTQAYRCRYPQNIQDCPVISEYEKKHLCEDCHNREEA